jgi:16S rRNA (guanine527-N7)-methyltransferase
MDSARILELLAPYLGDERLSAKELEQLAQHLALLQTWNAKTNLTSVRDPEEIVTRHFGESFFAARNLFPDSQAWATLVDVGSGAGFPGIPIAIARAGVQVTLVEAHGKKATFLKEVVRSTDLENVRVAAVRAEAFHETADVVILRAVEHFSDILPISARIVCGSGRLAALISTSQAAEANELMGDEWLVQPTVYLPDSPHQTLWIAQHR